MAVLVALVIGFALSRYQTHGLQNRGEARLFRDLKRRFVSPEYHLVNHVTPRQNDGTTQIDRVLVRFGIFVLENKDCKGWIFARRDDRFRRAYS
jgi:Nuclease-related domain